MRKLIYLIVLPILGLLFSCQNEGSHSGSISSPDGRVALHGFLNTDGQPGYMVQFDGKTVIDTSLLGFDFKDEAPMRSSFAIAKAETRSSSESWEMPWGEQRLVQNNFNELKLSLEETTGAKRNLNLIFRAYDDGVAFRYEFPKQDGLTELTILDENSEFALTGDHETWWIPGDWDSYEHLYNHTKVSEIDTAGKTRHPNLVGTYLPQVAVNTPVTMKTADGLYLSFHEANLTNYAGITLRKDEGSLTLTSELVGSERLGHKAKVELPFQTPWRTIQIADKAGDLIESNLIVNLNEPNKLGDISAYFKPMKYMGIWWHMHLTKKSWDRASGKHGATTAEAKRMIDYASKYGIEGLLVEGWNTGWEHWIGFDDREGVFDFVTPYPDYDIQEVVRYGNEKGVKLIMHHETSAAPRTYEQQLDTAYQLMQSLGIHAVKTGYVGPIIPKGEHHHGQWMVNHYRKVLDTAAKYQVAVNAHEPIMATGIRRTYPNAISREGLRGQEFNTFSIEGGNSTDHLTVVAFTRMLAGPIDYTPGVFKRDLRPYRDNSLNTTLAHDLALYVVVYSPVQMIADLPEHIGDHPFMNFIKEVGVDWEQSLVLDGEIGDYVTIARQERGTDRWFIGAITDENERMKEISLDFLPDGKEYVAKIYMDGKRAGFEEEFVDYAIDSKEVKKGDVLNIRLAPGGGAAVSLLPKE
ncbi:MAG: glycoside hydrolase family 97 protein [Bacteroidia bacterium]|nr:glycoside hydrolase family 97 protein [Bacteroidia bacterium]